MLSHQQRDDLCLVPIRLNVALPAKFIVELRISLLYDGIRIVDAVGIEPTTSAL